MKKNLKILKKKRERELRGEQNKNGRGETGLANCYLQHQRGIDRRPRDLNADVLSKWSVRLLLLGGTLH